MRFTTVLVAFPKATTYTGSSERSERKTSAKKIAGVSTLIDLSAFNENEGLMSKADLRVEVVIESPQGVLFFDLELFLLRREIVRMCVKASRQIVILLTADAIHRPSGMWPSRIF